MASNGKGNGKKPGASPASEPTKPASKANGNGKAKGPMARASDPPKPEVSDAATSKASAADEPVPAAEAVASAPIALPSVVAPEAVRGEAWGHPLARFEQKWTWVESRLLTFVLVWQILALCAWVFLNGLSESVTTTAGTVFRAVILASLAGAGAWAGMNPQRAGIATPEHETKRRNATLGAMAGALAVVLLWRTFALGGTGAARSLDHSVVAYFDNFKGWLQEGSTLTLLGGLRGLGTRLTLWLALLGGSLATASGKHIHIDVVFRFIPKRLRLPVSILNYAVAATVCFAAAWGFFDHIAIESYGSRAEDSASEKVKNAIHHVSNHAFLTRKQIGLDLRSLPHVLAGQRYDQWMTAPIWNAWATDAGFEDHYDPALVKNLQISDGTHPPFVVAPDGETTRSALSHTLGLVFPFGLLAIALRFILRALLTISGHFAADPDEAHREEIGHGGDIGSTESTEGGV
jgi:Tripartite ATP-independent periplasmic transporters, DctQ component